MNRSIFSLFVFIPALACAGEHAVSVPASGAPQVVASFATVDVQDLKRLGYEAEVFILDVRTAGEFAAGHMPAP